jgi:hypothetical protein
MEEKREFVCNGSAGKLRMADWSGGVTGKTATPSLHHPVIGIVSGILRFAVFVPFL